MHTMANAITIKPSFKYRYHHRTNNHQSMLQTARASSSVFDTTTTAKKRRLEATTTKPHQPQPPQLPTTKSNCLENNKKDDHTSSTNMAAKQQHAEARAGVNDTSKDRHNHNNNHNNNNHESEYDDHRQRSIGSDGARRSWQDDIKTGRFRRSPSAFRHIVRTKEEDPDAMYLPETGRYHLYLAKACPWANRMDTLVHMVGLQDCIKITFCDPVWGSIGNDRTGWRFSEEWPDTITHKETLYEVYLHYHPDYTGKATTPMLLDTKTGTIVCNESRDMLESICWGFRDFHSTPTIGQELFPRDRKEEIDSWIDLVYEPLLNGVYKCGFAGSQEAYNKAIDALFGCLDDLDDHLSKHQWMLPRTSKPTVLDLVVGVTLCRFDAIYYLHFLCCKKHVYEYPVLSNYARSFYQLPAVRKNTDLESCKQHYFRSHPTIAPSGLVAVANPQADLSLAHNRSPFQPRTPKASPAS